MNKKRKIGINKQVKSNKRAIQILRKAPERKIHLSFSPVGLLGIGPTIALLNPMTEGVGRTQRIGQTVQLVNLAMNIYLINGGTGITRCRVMLVIIKQPQGTDLVPDDLWSDLTSNFTRTACLRNTNLMGNFDVLFDKVIHLDGTVAAMARQERLIKIRKLLRYKIIFNAGNTGTFTSMEQNSLYVVFQTDSGVVTMYYEKQLGFHDV